MRVTIVLLLAASVGLGAIPDWDRGHLPGLTAVLLFAAICLTAYALIIPPLLRERFRRVIEVFPPFLIPGGLAAFLLSDRLPVTDRG